MNPWEHCSTTQIHPTHSQAHTLVALAESLYKNTLLKAKAAAQTRTDYSSFILALDALFDKMLLLVTIRGLDKVRMNE